MQEGSAQPCGCDAGAGHVCQWHTSNAKVVPGTYYDDRPPRHTTGYVHVDDHGAITPTVAMTTTATKAPQDEFYPHPLYPTIHHSVGSTLPLGKIEQLTTKPGVEAHKTWRLQSKIPAPAPVTTVPNYDHVLMGSPFTVKDSGARQEFASGMVRDTADGKIDYTSVLDGPMLVRWAEHLTKAKQKYPDVAPGVANWTLATGDAELDRFKKSAFRHFIQWMRGDVDEDHAAAVFFNVNGAEYVKGRR